MPRDPYDINAIFEEMIMKIIASLKRNFQRHKEDEMDEGFQWEMWQMAKLRAINAYRNRNKKIIENALNEAEKIVDEVLQESYEKGERRSLPLWYSFVNLILKPFKKEIVRVEGDIKLPVDFEPKVPGQNIPHHLLPQAPPEESFFKVNEKKLGALQQSVKNDLRKAQFAVLRKMDDVYRQVIYKAEVNMAAGAKTLNQAIDMATKEFLSKGINTIQYADGRMVDIASYAETALRTASQRATFLGEGKKRDEWGIYTVVMSTHDNCSPWCLPYQGKVMIDDVYTSIPKERAQQLSKQMGYPLLSTAMSNGAFHPNCRHTLSTFFPGVSKLPPKTDSKKALANYKAEQKQRFYERQIRKYKRLEAGSLDEENQAKYSAKVKEWQEKLKAHLEENPQLRRNYRREKVEGEIKEKERKKLLQSQKEYLDYKKVFGDEIPDRATFDRLRNSEDWSLVQLDYRRRKRLIDNQDLRLPNADKAIAVDAKFTRYLFNPDNPIGYAKGAAFSSRLGYNINNWEELQRQIIANAKKYPATLKLTNQYGEKWEQKQIIYGPNGRVANVIVGWNVSSEGTKMTTAYIKEVKKNGED